MILRVITIPLRGAEGCLRGQVWLGRWGYNGPRPTPLPRLCPISPYRRTRLPAAFPTSRLDCNPARIDALEASLETIWRCCDRPCFHAALLCVQDANVALLVSEVDADHGFCARFDERVSYFMGQFPLPGLGVRFLVRPPSGGPDVGNWPSHLIYPHRLSYLVSCSGSSS